MHRDDGDAGAEASTAGEYRRAKRVHELLAPALLLLGFADEVHDLGQRVVRRGRGRFDDERALVFGCRRTPCRRSACRPATDSPVTAASSTRACRRRRRRRWRRPSPGRTRNRSPTASASRSISRPRRRRAQTVTRFGARSIRARMASRVRSSVNSSSASEIEYRNASAAASDHSPSPPRRPPRRSSPVRAQLDADRGHVALGGVDGRRAPRRRLVVVIGEELRVPVVRAQRDLHAVTRQQFGAGAQERGCG
jgi:hypothetical protein